MIILSFPLNSLHNKISNEPPYWEKNLEIEDEGTYWQNTSDEEKIGEILSYFLPFQSYFLENDYSIKRTVSVNYIRFSSFLMFCRISSYISHEIKHLSWQRRNRHAAPRFISESSFLNRIGGAKQPKNSFHEDLSSQIDFEK